MMINIIRMSSYSSQLFFILIIFIIIFINEFIIADENIESISIEVLNEKLKSSSSSSSTTTASTSNQCELYLAPSLIAEAGRGVIAGINYEIDHIIETSPTIIFPQEISAMCQLDNYVFSTEDDDYSMLIFGPGSLYNHASSYQSIQHYWNEHDVKPPNEISDMPYSDYTYCYFQLLKEVKIGQEIFEHYGDEWFDRFDGLNKTKNNNVTNDIINDTIHKSKLIEAIPTNYEQKIDLDLLKKVGHCLTDVSVAESTLIDAGHGLFAERSFKKDEIVTISPVLTLPREVVDYSAESSLLMNYCISRADSNMALFLINYAALINHNSLGEPNLRMEWYDWKSLKDDDENIKNDTNENQIHLKSSTRLKLSPEELFDLPFAPLDLAFIATRPIEQGEELFIDYGSYWMDSWEEYLAAAMEESERLSMLDVDDVEQLSPEVQERIAIECGDLCISQSLEDASACEECTQSVLVDEANMNEWVYFRRYIEAPDGLFPDHWLYDVEYYGSKDEL